MRFGSEDRREKARGLQELYDADFDYKYPEGLDLRPGSELSQRIVNEVLDRAEMSQSELNKLKPEWKEMDRTLNAYMPAGEWDMDVNELDPRRPTTIVVPMSFAMREVYQTYMRNRLMSGDMVHLYRGTGSVESKIQGAKLELLVAKHSLWFKERLKLDMAVGDAFTYGRGLVSINWAKHMGQSPVVEEVTDLMSFALSKEGVNLPTGTIMRYLEERIIFEGSELSNIDMYQTFLDPSVTPNDLQESEYIGWLYRTNAMSVMRREGDPEENMFNGRYLYIATKKGEGRSAFWNRDDGRGRDGGAQDMTPTDDFSNSADVIQLHIELVPEDWGLGDGTTPEKWVFAVAADSVVIQADKLRNKHNMFPVAMFAPGADGHTVAPGSHLMATAGINKFMNWMLKSRADAVNTILNGLIFYDPSKVEEEDMLNPGQGKLVRVRNTAYGESRISDFVHQMVMQDPTQGHMANIAELDQIARNGNGTGDMVMGRPDQLPDRPTAAGINAMQGNSFSRLDLLASRIEEQGLLDIGYQMGFNAIQYQSTDIQSKIVGRYEAMLRSEYGTDMVDIAPWDIAALSFEVEPRSAMRPGIDDTNAMTQMISTLMGVEGVGQQLAMDYDISRVYQAYLRKLGFEDVEEFLTQGNGPVATPNMQVLPDQQVQQQAQAGNLVGA